MLATPIRQAARYEEGDEDGNAQTERMWRVGIEIYGRRVNGDDFIGRGR